MKLRARKRRLVNITARQALKMHGLSGKIAMLTGALTGTCALLIILVYGTDVIIPVAIFVGISIFATYYSARHFLDARIELARSTLRRTRKYKFGKLDEADFPKGDELNELIRQVYRTGQLLEREIRQLRQVADYRRAFIGNVSHELKTPIFSIQGYAETLLEGALENPDVNRRFIERIVRNADRLSSLTSDLIEISRIESGELKMHFVPFGLYDIVSEIFDSLEPNAAKNQIRMRASIPSDLPHVSGDPQHIRQALVNLLDNAIKYTDAGGEVKISAQTQNGSVLIAVSDTGIGIAKKYIPRVTERFFRIDKSRSRSAGGTGLGLAIVKHILAAHQQNLRVSSKPDVGSTFRFQLPVAGSKTAVGE